VPGIENGCTEVAMKATEPAKPVATDESKNELTDPKQPVVQEQGGKRPRPSWRRTVPGTENGCTEVAMKATQPIKPVATANSKNRPTDREPVVPHEQGGQRPRRGRRVLTTMEDDWSRLDCQRGHLKTLSIPWDGTNTSKKPETVAESKYEPTDYERAVLAKQAQRLKDQLRVPRIRFVEDYGGGRPEFDHPDQAIALALLREAFGTADDRFAKGLVGYLCAALPADENSAYEYPRADDLNHAVSIIAARKAVDEVEAAIFADVAVCRVTGERLLHNLREPLRFDLSDELKFALYYYKHNPKDEIDREVKIDNRPVLEFSLRYVTRLMTIEIELIAAADRHRAIVESSRKVQQLSAVTPVDASLGEIKHATLKATPKIANASRARRLNGSAVSKLPQKTDSTTARKSNGHTPT
jgi:hypothetical protein